MNSTNNGLVEKTISGIIWKFLERVGTQLVTVIVSLVLARILMPEDYGIVALVTVLIALCNVFVTNGLGSSLIQKKDADSLDFSTVFYTGLIVSAILYMLLFLSAPVIAHFYGNDLLSPVLRVMGLSLPVAAVNSVQQAYVSRRMIFRKFFFATLAGTVVSGAIGLTMAFSGCGVWALVGQYTSNVLVNTFTLFWIVRWHPKWEFSFSRLKGLLSFGWKLFVSGFLDTGYNELQSLVIGKKYSTEALAFYEKGREYPKFLATSVNTSFSAVLFSAMSKVKDDPEKVKYATRRSIRTCSYLLMPCMTGIACIAPVFTEVILGEKWLPMVPYMQMMCIVYAFWPIHTANLEALKAMGRSDLYLTLEIIKKTTGIVALIVSMQFGVFWIAFSMIITTFISAFVNAFPNRKLLKYGFGEQLLDILPNIGLSFMMGLSVYFLRYLPLPRLVVLGLQILLGISVYILVSFLFHSAEFAFLVSYIKRLWGKRKKYG